MKPASRWPARLLLALVATTLSAPAFAQTGIVLEGPTPVRQWRNAGEIALTVSAGTVLEIIERDHDWCWVVLPPDTFGTRRVGWVPTAVLQISGTPPPEVLPSGIVPLPAPESADGATDGDSVAGDGDDGGGQPDPAG